METMYKFGRRPFILFTGIILFILLLLQITLSFQGFRGTNPTHPEWKASFDTLRNQLREIFKKLVYAGSFVLGVSQAVKKQKEVMNPDLTYVVLYGKLVCFLLAVEFACGLITNPSRQKEKISGTITGSVVDFFQDVAGSSAREMVNGVATGFGYGYLIRGVGYLFQRYPQL